MAVSPRQLVELLSPWLGSGPTYRAVAVGTAWPGARRSAAGRLAVALGARAGGRARRRSQHGHGGVRRASGRGLSAQRPRRRQPDRHPGGGSGPPGCRTGAELDLLDLTVAALPAPGLLLDAVERATAALPPLLAGHGLYPLGLPDPARVGRRATSRHEGSPRRRTRSSSRTGRCTAGTCCCGR